jgi:iron complex transport system ATP-binding protein
MAVAQGARLLLLDEPTVHLDLRHQVEVMELLRDLAHRDAVTVLAVLHDMTLASHFFDRLLLLSDGRLVADGAPGDVLTNERIQDVFGIDPALVRTI